MVVDHFMMVDRGLVVVDRGLVALLKGRTVLVLGLAEVARSVDAPNTRVAIVTHGWHVPPVTHVWHLAGVRLMEPPIRSHGPFP